MKVDVSFGSSQKLTLNKALLFYEDGSAALITEHDVVTVSTLEGPQVSLGPGSLVSRETLVKMIRRVLDVPETRPFLAPEILSYEPGHMFWWVPAARRPIFFMTKGPFDKEIENAIVWHPPLLMHATYQFLTVWALGKNERPLETDLVYRSPYYNLGESGIMCAGNVALPETPSPDTRLQWEDAFFLSNFTHTNLKTESHCLHPLGHNGFWRQARHTEDINDLIQYLIPMEGKTVGQFVGRI